MNRLVVLLSLVIYQTCAGMSSSDKLTYKNIVREMFFHAYNNYMNFAYPADELMPLSCKGRVRGVEPSRGDIDETMGKFSLTLIDSLDTLAVMGAIEEFSNGIKTVIRDVRFDSDLVVSVFETNIRVLGGLLGAHFAADTLKRQGHPLLHWYSDELVSMAQTVGDKLLPAFNTTTGIPYARINLRHGINYSDTLGQTTCTACAGTLLMEFGALSFVTGDPKYKLKAQHAMEVLWNKRQQQYQLVGTVINVHNGQWTNKAAGVGAGVDSYYEYCLKSYILLGNKEYLKRFTAHYSAVKQYISNGPFLLEVNMNTPLKPSRNFMDSLLAFWPGLQVLWGDIAGAISTHNLLYEVIQRHRFIPEAFSTDHNFKTVWPEHPLRPEFIESTYFLYKATDDPYYLEVGRLVVDNLNKFARVTCGFACIKNVNSKTHEDRMDSFFLAETLKYLYLLFAEDSDIPFELDDFIFTTEAHIIPLSLSLYSNNVSTATNDTQSNPDLSPTNCSDINLPWLEVNIYYNLLMKQCSASRYTFPLDNTIIQNKLIRKVRRESREKLNLKTLDFSNKQHVLQLEEMGISFEIKEGNRIMLYHNPNKAVSKDAAHNGAELIQQVLKISQVSSNSNKREIKMLRIIEPKLSENYEFIAGPAQFGPDLGGDAHYQVTSEIVLATSPRDGCDTFSDEERISGKVVLIQRGGCMFIHKVRNAQRGGAIGAVIYDNNIEQVNKSTNPVFPFSMSGDGTEDVTIPSVFISRDNGLHLLNLIESNYVKVLMTWATPEDIEKYVNESNETGSDSSKSGCQGDNCDTISSSP